MANFKKTNAKLFSKYGLETISDNIHWRNNNASVLLKEFGPIDYIDFSPIEPHHFAVTCSCRVQIYNPVTKLVTKNLNKFKKVAYGGTFRKDGRLFCVGGEEAVVKLFDVNTKSSLRIFSGHSAAVHRTFFTLDGTRIVSFSDDKSSVLWDIPSEKKILSFEEHTDYVRAGGVSQISPDIYISGGYDKIVNMYDTRTNEKVFSVNHEAPVESLIFLPSGGIFLSAGGTEIRVWDCLTNGKLLAKISHHHKTITCLQITHYGKQILSGSLDRNVKIYDSGTYKAIHTLHYPNSVLSIGVSADNETLVTGMIDGMISITQREQFIKKENLNRQSISYRNDGENLHSPRVNTFVQDVPKEIIGMHDACLRKFQYSKALDHVMKNYIVNKSPQLTVALFQELIRRQGLVQALTGRDTKSVANIIKFLTRHIGNIKFGQPLLHVTNVLVDTYEEELEECNLKSQKVFELLVRKLHEEEELILSLIELRGSFETILTASETTINPVKKFSNFGPSLIAQKDLILNIL